MKKNIFSVAVLALLSIVVSSCSNGDTKADIVGLGSNFPEPFYLSAFDAYYTKTNKTISYNSVGSYKAIESLLAQKGDFAASDEFITDADQAELKIKPIIHIPTCLIGVAISYNLPGISRLNLSGDVLADIYMGKITMWNDSRIIALNPTDSLPEKKIIPVFRPDGCGRTFLLSSYLSSVSEEWKEQYGSHMLIKFPVGMPVKGNSAIASTVQGTPYSLGYIGADFANVVGLPVASIANACGEFVAPTSDNIAKAAHIRNISADSRVLLVNSPAKGAYPISSFTWMIVFQEQNYNHRTKTQAENTVALMQYMLSNTTQQVASDDEYSPLPKIVIDNALNSLKQVTYDGVPILK